MRYLIVSCVYPPEPVVSSQTSATLASALAARGDDVEVITAFPSRPGGSLYAGYRRRWRHRRYAEGVTVTRVPATLSRRSTGLSRGMENLSFGVLSAIALLRSPRPDVVYINSWPMFASGLAAAAARFRGIPYVVSVQDLYPESLIASGRRGLAGALFAALSWLDGHIARAAAAVVVVAEQFVEPYRGRGVASDSVHVVHNWVRATPPPSDEAIQRYREALGVRPDAFLVTYAGNVGAAAGVPAVIDGVAAIDDPRVVLCIAGAGSELALCERLCRELLPGRHVIRSPWPRDETGPLLGASDLLLLPTNAGQGHTSVPSKLIAYMLAGRAVLAAVPAESATATTVESAQCGMVTLPGDAAALAARIQEMRALPASARLAMGDRGRSYALRQFSDDVCVPRVLTILDSAARSPSGGPERTSTSAR